MKKLNKDVKKDIVETVNELDSLISIVVIGISIVVIIVMIIFGIIIFKALDDWAEGYSMLLNNVIK